MSDSNFDYSGTELEILALAVNYHRWILSQFQPYLGATIAEVGAGIGSFSKLLLETSPQRLFAFEPSIPITFELTVLFGGLSAFFGFFGLGRLPEPYHPVFEAESFRRASIDAFFVSIEVPAGTAPAAVAADVKSLGSIDVQIVEESER